MKTKTILICDDEAEAAATIKSIVTKRGYSAVVCKDGVEVVQQAKDLHPDLILMDIRMPKRDGLEAAGLIREFDADARIVFITAFQSPEIEQEARKFDISGYVVKPLSAEHVVREIKKALGD